MTSYLNDDHFSKVLSTLKKEKEQDINHEHSQYPQYELGEKGILFFINWDNTSRMCVGKSIRDQLISQIHDTLIEGAHAGYHRTYNRIATLYYWPRMNQDIRKYVSTCDVCQKIKHRRQASPGLLQPLPIPADPFEVITMDFFTELPESDQFNAILVVVDKLTKYGHFIPTHSTATAKETAQLVFQHIIAHYGLPRQFISDRDR